MYYVRQPYITVTIKFEKCDSFALCFMVNPGVSFHGKSKLRIFDRGVKVDSLSINYV